MKLISLSDTHGCHSSIINLPSGDVIVHAGDISAVGAQWEIEDFLEWFKNLDYEYKIFIAGNHDILFQKNPQLARQLIPNEIIYLENEMVKVDGLTFYGSPYTPTYGNFAFMRSRGKEMEECWMKIPEDVDVLITHGPPFGILDLSRNHKHSGCVDLSNRLREIKPRLHLFGHIHEGYGTFSKDSTLYYNSSILDERYRQVNAPIEIDL